MNILIDFLTAHGRYGAGEYHRRIVMTMLSRIEKQKLDDIHLFALYDSRISISFEDMREDYIGKRYGIKFADLSKQGLIDIIDSYNIDRFFIACGQRIGEYPEIAQVKCEVICVTHDLLFEEWYNNHLYEYWDACRPSANAINSFAVRQIKNTFYSSKHLAKLLIKRIIGKKTYKQGEKELGYMSSVVTMIKNNPKCTNIMVSDYSRATMMYNFGIPKNRIKVYYSPERIETPMKEIENPKLKELVSSKKKYYLMVSSDRECKNPYKAASAFDKYRRIDESAYLVMVGNNRTPLSDRQINMEFLSDSDLCHAMKNCYALLYPSFFEGFGYPPLETMKYGKPVICSNTTSIPEILQDAPVYFCPFYESSIFHALTQLTSENYSYYSKKSIERYSVVREKQERDLEELVNIILDY